MRADQGRRALPRDGRCWIGTALDTPDPQALASFYQRLLGWELGSSDPTWATIAPPSGGIYLGFHASAGYRRPTWPPVDGEQQQMMHLDLEVTDVEAAVEVALGAGATLAAFQPQDDVRVMLDPDGHPFCLYAGGNGDPGEQGDSEDAEWERADQDVVGHALGAPRPHRPMRAG